ncbi:hypothetical protein CBL_20376 [Carabus blaptoides fortunei]
MKVKLASQLFSNSVADAKDPCREDIELENISEKKFYNHIDLIEEERNLSDKKYTGKESVKKSLQLLESVNCVLENRRSEDPRLLRNIINIIRNRRVIDNIIKSDFDLIEEDQISVSEASDHLLFWDQDSDIESLPDLSCSSSNMGSPTPVLSTYDDGNTDLICSLHPNAACSCIHQIVVHQQIEANVNQPEYDMATDKETLAAIPSGLAQLIGNAEMSSALTGTRSKTKIVGPTIASIVPEDSDIDTGRRSDQSTTTSDSTRYLTPDQQNETFRVRKDRRIKYLEEIKRVVSPVINLIDFSLDREFNAMEFSKDLITELSDFEDVIKNIGGDYTKNDEIYRQMIAKSYSQIYQGLRHWRQLDRIESKLGQTQPYAETKKERSRSRGRSQVRFQEVPREDAIHEYEKIKTGATSRTRIQLLISRLTPLLKIMADNNDELRKQVDDNTLNLEDIDDILNEMEAKTLIQYKLKSVLLISIGWTTACYKSYSMLDNEKDTKIMQHHLLKTGNKVKIAAGKIAAGFEGNFQDIETTKLLITSI